MPVRPELADLIQDVITEYGLLSDPDIARRTNAKTLDVSDTRLGLGMRQRERRGYYPVPMAEEPKTIPWPFPWADAVRSVAVLRDHLHLYYDA